MSKRYSYAYRVNGCWFTTEMMLGVGWGSHIYFHAKCFANSIRNAPKYVTYSSKRGTTRHVYLLD